MPWHTGKPAADDFLSVSVQHIRENFAELEPLHPHVAALVDTAALAPHVAALVDTAALAPHVAALMDTAALAPHVDALADIAPYVDVLKDTAALAPHVDTLLSSRIVEHNLDTGSSNGYYIRYANGMQVCWKTGLLAQLYDYDRFSTEWVFPAEFADAGYFLSLMPVWVSGDTSISSSGRGFYIDSTAKNTNEVGIWILISSSDIGDDTIHADALAVGRWAD